MTGSQNNHPEQLPGKGMAGGFFIAAGLVIGAIIGIIYDQPSIGMVAGFGVGLITAIAIWLLDRRKA
jgi:hypothetical protein